MPEPTQPSRTASSEHPAGPPPAGPPAGDRPPSAGLIRLVFGSLPLLAAIGPLLTAYRGLFAFRLVCAFLIAGALVLLLGRGRWRAPDVWLVLLTLSMTVAGLAGLDSITPLSDNPYSEFLAIVLGLFTALASRAWQRASPGIYLALARGWVVAAILVSLAAAAEVVTGHHLPGYLESADPEPAFAFGNPNALAIFLVMANVWAMGVRRTGGAGWRIATWLVVLATPPLVYLTNARLAGVVWVVVLAWSIWQELRRFAPGVASLGRALVPAVLAVGVLLVIPRVVSVVVELSTTGSSGNVREALTRYGIAIAVDHRGLPTWPGSFEALITERGVLQETEGITNAHDMWVEILVQYGALSLLLFLGWLVACVVAKGTRRADTAPAVVALLLLGFVDSSLLDDAQLWLFVLTLALASRAGPGTTTGAVPTRARVEPAGAP